MPAGYLGAPDCNNCCDCGGVRLNTSCPLCLQVELNLQFDSLINIPFSTLFAACCDPKLRFTQLFRTCAFPKGMCMAEDNLYTHPKLGALLSGAQRHT